MNQLTSISIRGFRRLEDVRRLELRPLNVLIGANGAGKSSFLEAMRLLGRSARMELRAAVDQAGGLSSLLTAGRAEELTLIIEGNIECSGADGSHRGSELRYEMSLDPQGLGYSIKEFLELPGAPDALEPSGPPHPFTGQRVFGADPTFETKLAQVTRQNPGWAFREWLSGLSHYAARDLDLSARGAVRLPQPIRPTPLLPGQRGEDLISCLYSMRETRPDSFAKVCDGLSAVFPSFERIDFPPVAAGTLAFTWKDREYNRPFYAHELSDGTLRFLWLATLLGSPELTSLALIDEPEVSLHPGSLRVLADLLREAAMQAQVVVATHSEALVRFLEPREILVVDMENGQPSLKWADTLDLATWLQEYTLDELWAMNRLGGNP